MFKRISIFLYGVVCYAVFFATFLYAIGFIGNFAVPATLDGIPAMSTGKAVVIDMLLLGIFALQHSLMARPFFKRWFTRFIPESAERSTYVLLSSLALIALFIFWQPLGGMVWNVQDPAARGVLLRLLRLRLVAGAGVDLPHQSLRPVRPAPGVAAAAWASRTRISSSARPARTGWCAIRCTWAGCSAFWATPTMTGTHLLFAFVTTAYILVAIQFEETDLVDSLGEDYRRYRERVPMIIPALGRTAPKAARLNIDA